jgi:Lrp/AsnC family transcriptional regulator, leucine-responsive regulatory protein
MDLIDRKLLDAVQRDAWLTNEQLSERVGASPSAVQRRLARLRASRVIREVRAIVDQKAVGRPLTFVVGLEIERKRNDLYGRLQQWISAEPSIQQTYNVTGASDFILVVTAATLEGYDALMAKMIVDNPNVRKFTTSVVLQTFKQDMFVPTLDAEE